MFGFKNAGDLKEKSSSGLIVKAKLFSGLRESLTRKPGAKDIMVWDVFIPNVADVVAGVYPVIGFIDLNALLVDVGGQDTPPSEKGKSLMESADTAEQINKREIIFDGHEFIL
jgi:hypothetical protein